MRPCHSGWGKQHALLRGNRRLPLTFGGRKVVIFIDPEVVPRIGEFRPIVLVESRRMAKSGFLHVQERIFGIASRVQGFQLYG